MRLINVGVFHYKSEANLSLQDQSVPFCRGSKTCDMVKLVICVALLFVAIATAAECPSYTKVLNCTPKCWQDTECSAIGGKCCPNVCNGRSCAQPNVLSKSGYNDSPGNGKNMRSGGPGTYCGNVKCSPFERCIMDPSTKRMRCMRK